MDLNDTFPHARLRIRAHCVRQPSEQWYGMQRGCLQMLNSCLSTSAFYHLKIPDLDAMLQLINSRRALSFW